jgi:uncharacterized membrane protein
MDKLKSISWKTVVYWFCVMTLMNVYIIPKYINHQAITIKRIVVGVVVSFVVSILMGVLSVKKDR